MKNLDKDTMQDIQFLLIQYAGYIEDTGRNAWKDKKFKKIADKYGFTENNIYKGFEYECC